MFICFHVDNIALFLNYQAHLAITPSLTEQRRLESTACFCNHAIRACFVFLHYAHGIVHALIILFHKGIKGAGAGAAASFPFSFSHTLTFTHFFNIYYECLSIIQTM